MRFQDDGLPNLDQLVDADREQPKKAKITYARNFLQSLSELELCKQLPDGFDKSILSEFHDAFHDSQEKARVSGGFTTQNFRHTEYSASPPTRRDANFYSRGSAGKWESRSRDINSQSDRDSESGKQFGTDSRRPWQNSEHDGLLGSGSSPKLTGYTSGTSVPKLGGNDPNHVKRSNATYQPPRPYKAVPHNWSATSDLHNDETFGSLDMTSDDRTEEERKRRAEFELMRKERHKSSQSKQSSGPVSSTVDLVSEAVEDHGNLIDEKKILSESNESHVTPTVLAPHSGFTKSSPSLQTSAARPVVPPGFVPPGFGNTNVFGKSTVKPDTKVETSEINSHPVHGTLKSSVERTCGDKTVKQPDNQTQLDITINSLVGGFDLLVNGKELDSNKGPVQHAAAVSNQNFSTPLLEDIFCNSLTANGGCLSILAEDIDGNITDKLKGSTVESSKFAPWFVEDGGKELSDDGLAEKPIDLFSLVGGGLTSKVIPVDPTAAKSTDPNVPVLTCEDLEQSILSEMNQHGILSETLLQGSESRDVHAAQLKSIDALASQHLLSVLQKGHGPDDMDPSSYLSQGSTSMNIATHSSEQQKTDIASVAGKNPTLEAIFGSAFMKELQASDAPVSTKRDSDSDSSRFRVPEDEILISGIDRLNPSNSLHAHVESVNNSGYAPSNLPLTNPGRLGVLSAMFRDGRSIRQSEDNQVVHNDSFGTMDYNSMYQNSQAHSSPPQLPTQHTIPGLPMFNQQEAHHHPPQIRFSNNMTRHNPPTARHFSPSHPMFNQPRPMGFEPLSQHPLMQQAHLPGSAAAPSHLLRQYSGNVLQPPHPYGQVHGFRQELNPMQRLHTGHQLPGFRGNGMSTPVNIVSSNPHPELLQRLMDMELRSNSKPNHPLAGHLGRLPNT